MPTTRRKIVRRRHQRISQEALDAFLDRDEDRLRKALGLGPHEYSPMPVPGGYAIDPGQPKNVTPNNNTYDVNYAQYLQLEALAKQYRAENGIPEPKPTKTAVKRKATKRRAKTAVKKRAK